MQSFFLWKLIIHSLRESEVFKETDTTLKLMLRLAFTLLMTVWRAERLHMTKPFEWEQGPTHLQEPKKIDFADMSGLQIT